jgi:uncharacterized membrane protein YbhN (UPF0104 family)
MFRRIRKNFGRFTPFLVSVVLLTALATQTNGFRDLLNVRWELVLAAVAQSLVLNIFLAAFKLWLLMRYLDIDVPYLRILRLILGLLATTFFTPFQTGHVLYGLALKRLEDVKTFEAFECVAYDKFLTLLGSMVLIAVGWLFVPADHILAPWWIPALAVAAIASLFLIRCIKPLLLRVRSLRQHSKLLARPLSIRRKVVLLGLATAYQATDSISMLFACWALGVDVNLGVLLAVSQVVLLLSLAPFGVSGLGIRESLMAFFFLGTLSLDQGIAAGLVVDFTEYVVPAIVGSIVLPSILKELRRRRGSGGLRADGGGP